MFGRNLVARESLPSTNSLLKEFADRGAVEGTVLISEEQTAGKGRMGRSWLSPKGTNLLFSILLRPPMIVDDVFILTMALALSAIDAVEDVSGLSASIKWPNDLYVANGKLAGILTEFSTEGRRLAYVVLGLGMNVNWSPGKPAKSAYRATSIFEETGRIVSRELLLVLVLKGFERAYGDVLSGKRDAFLERWNSRCMVLGRRVEIDTPEGKVFGNAIRIDSQGALIIKDHQGQEKKIRCGDVSVHF